MHLACVFIICSWLLVFLNFMFTSNRQKNLTEKKKKYGLREEDVRKISNLVSIEIVVGVIFFNITTFICIYLKFKYNWSSSVLPITTYFLFVISICIMAYISQFEPERFDNELKADSNYSLNKWNYLAFKYTGKTRQEIKKINKENPREAEFRKVKDELSKMTEDERNSILFCLGEAENTVRSYIFKFIKNNWKVLFAEISLVSVVGIIFTIMGEDIIKTIKTIVVLIILSIIFIYWLNNKTSLNRKINTSKNLKEIINKINNG